MKKIIATWCALLTVAGVQAQIHAVDFSTLQPHLYERTDAVIRLTASYDNPYLHGQAALDMLLTAPSGDERLLPCYWVAGGSGEVSEWAARFTPQQEGRWECRFRLTENGVATSFSEPVALDVQPARNGDCHGILHTNDYWTLAYDDGTLFRGVAENICWESRAEDDSRFFKALHEQHDRFNYDVMLPDFASNGGNFIRVWMCDFNFPIDKQRDFNSLRYTPSDEYFNPSAVARLDHFVGLCESLGIRVMLCMGQGNVRADREFFTGEEQAQRYIDRLRYIVARWSYSPAIAMWEFFNEIDNIQFRDSRHPIPAEDIVAWHARMSRELKGMDAHGHIVTTSISHRDLKGLNSVADIDINQKHIYCNTSGIPSEILRYENRFGKPYVIGEFGYEWDWSKNFDEFGDDMDRDFRRGLWYGIFSPTPVTPMSWWWEYFANRGMTAYFNGVRRISDRMLAEGGSFEQLSATCGDAEAMVVRCGETVYAYLRNGSGEPVDGASLVVNLGCNALYEVESFDPETCLSERAESLDAPGRFVLDGVSLDGYAERIYIFTPVK